MLSSTFPASYTQSDIRHHLGKVWGLGPMRQDAVLLLAVSQKPSSPIDTTKGAEEFVVRLATEYFHKESLPLPSRACSGPLGAGSAVMDSKALNQLQESSSSLVKSVVEVLSNHLDGATHPLHRTLSVMTDENRDATATLSMLQDEHGDDYVEGVRPKFKRQQQRLFDSFWNWAAQDIHRFYLASKDAKPGFDGILHELTAAISNRLCARTIAQISHLRARADSCADNDVVGCSMSRLHETCLALMGKPPVYINRSRGLAPITAIDGRGRIVYSQAPRESQFGQSYEPTQDGVEVLHPTANVSRFRMDGVKVSPRLTRLYARERAVAAVHGLNFSGRNVLVTGAGEYSIGCHVLQGLLAGGARVTVTTSSYSPAATKMYQALYASHGATGSVLRVVPFNQGSTKDVRDLIRWIYEDVSWDLDFVVPFAAMSEVGKGLENIDSRSEVAHRLMTTNLLRMLGEIARCKGAVGTQNRPATVVVPLSPNHGQLGNDGLYSESKMSLQTLLAKWWAEPWADRLSLLGVIIGWTRGTGLMGSNDTLAQSLETMGIRTFDAPEMAANILALLGGSINSECQSGPLVIDLGGGLDKMQAATGRLSKARSALYAEAGVKRAIAEERARDAATLAGHSPGSPYHAATKRISPRANIKLPLPALPDYERVVAPLAASLEGMVDTTRVVVITGFSELGPCGNSRTRWEMETAGALSTEGSIEMAWMMGLVKHGVTQHPDGSQSAGWVDAATSTPVDDELVPIRYAQAIQEHTGLRPIEPDICDDNYDPSCKTTLQEVTLQRDLGPFETTTEIGDGMLQRHGDKVSVFTTEPGSCRVQLRAGATIMVPRSSSFNRTVAGQIPSGWSAKRYGISDDIVNQVDPVTLFSLVCTVEAFLCSGVTDPYEWYRHVHVSELAICIGSGMGGLSSGRQMHRDRFIDKDVKSDVLQETFVNTIGAWINMLLVSSAGPLKTPVGACATSLESLDTAYDLIVSRKARVALVGGVEDFTEDLSYEFGRMNATCDTDAEYAAGRSPREMSRPTASSRRGFVEAQGCGVQVVTTADLALKMGLPIFGIVAHTSMSADKAGRSVPAAGKGVIVNAREPSYNHALPPGSVSLLGPPLLSLAYRRQALSRRRNMIAAYVQESMVLLEDEIRALVSQEKLAPEVVEEYRLRRAAEVEEEGRQQNLEAAFCLGNDFWRRDGGRRISPIRGALATWGLDVDDISVASLHGTSTVKNDTNEAAVIQEQMRHLGRQRGNMLPCVCQKWLTGHSKGAAGAWMINGCLQMMDSGRIPGNRNADNIDDELRQHEHLWFPSISTQTADDPGIKACSVTSFGFGQKGSQAILVHPRYLYATIPRSAFEEYALKRDGRWQRACRSYTEAMVNEDMVASRLKSEAPYPPSCEVASLLNPLARF
ncbi:fatty acid synthase subunit alpha reductase [Purpureocillium lavendulum]|uniref:beta-ketoacyl-[acyl-carrier-protein] synthase I n=1 Tax=Purpureocillium lavendulum TaxID=1247861 RepID=A0AB34FUR4_9HYPO|nr:fatty acid synthase subunit alpha reductase [Purpureocillium lavendulum]